MGPLLMAGLAILGGTVAIGLLARATTATPRTDEHRLRGRSLAIIHMAFAQGALVQGVVVGLLAVMLGVPRPPGSGLVAAVPGIAGAILGLTLLFRDRATQDARATFIALNFLLGGAALGVVVAILSETIVEVGTVDPPDWPFALAGLFSAAAAIGIGLSGAAALRSLEAADPTDLQAATGRQVARAAPFEAVCVLATVVAILVLFNA